MRSLAAGLLAGLAACSSEDPLTAVHAGESAPRHLELCVSCHGRDGRARISGYPHIAGQDARYQLEQLRRYRSGERKHAGMRAVAGLLTDEDMRALSAHYARQPACPPAAP